MIYVNFKHNNLRELIKGLYEVNGNAIYNYVCKATYSDKGCAYEQCGRGRHRSFDDLLELAKTYYPKTTPKLNSTIL